MKIVNGYRIEPEASLRGVNLQGTNLIGMNLGAADLRGADLQGADLRGADLSGADLRGANLEGANLGAVNLGGTLLSGAFLHETKNILMIGPIGSRGDILYAVKFPKTIMFKVGCFWGTGPQLLIAANETHGIGSPVAIQYRAAINLARVIFKQYDKLDIIPF